MLAEMQQSLPRTRFTLGFGSQWLFQTLSLLILVTTHTCIWLLTHIGLSCLLPDLITTTLPGRYVVVVVVNVVAVL